MTIERIKPATGGILWAKREMEQVVEWAKAHKLLDIVKLIREAYNAGEKAGEAYSKRMWDSGYNAGLAHKSEQEEASIRAACRTHREKKFDEMLNSIHTLVEIDPNKPNTRHDYILSDFSMEQLHKVEEFIKSFNND